MVRGDVASLDLALRWWWKSVSLSQQMAGARKRVVTKPREGDTLSRRPRTSSLP